MRVNIIGGGLAGCEAALYLSSRGVKVTLYEMRPHTGTPAHASDFLAELVCSNSLKSDTMPTAQGLLKREMRMIGSTLLEIAHGTQVPAGKALAVDRVLFAREVTQSIENDPNITVCREEVLTLDGVESPVIVSTGPLTSDALAGDLERSLGEQRLFFFDAISPILEAESIDFSELFKADRYGDDEGDYWNIPLDEDHYRELVNRLRSEVPPLKREWEQISYFESCLPIEEMARRGDDALAFGPFRPVGFRRPDGTRPHAVIQLRLEDIGGNSYNLVGCQTRLSQESQRRLFRALPGLRKARFLRYGQLHRNTFIDSPRLLTATLALKSDERIRFAGQLCGTEGYVESLGTGLLAGVFTYHRLVEKDCDPPPPETMMGALCHYVSSSEVQPFQPMNANFGMLPPAPPRMRPRRVRRAWSAAQALKKFHEWVKSSDLE